MYYPWGWARLLRLPQEAVQEIEQVVCNRDKILAAVLTADSVLIWYVKPCVPIISHRRSPASVQELGRNILVQWRPDSSMLVVVTELGHLIIYHLVVPTDVKTLYELIDPPTPSLRRESDELFVKELIPPLIFSLAFEVEVEGGVTDLVAIREELMIATNSGKILRYSWEGQEIRDYSLDLRRIPFCVDQQVLKAVPLTDKGVNVSKIAYSPLIGGYALVFNDGRAAFLVASTLHFDPNSVTGIWALQLEDANSVALNHKYKLIAFGRKNSQGVVYGVDEMTGGLTVSHRLILPTRDYPGNPGPVSCLKWTPDGTALVLAWQRGGFSLWSTFGAMIMCSLGWDYGPHVSDPVGQNPLCIKSLDWSAEGYQMWIINAKNRTKKEVDPDFMPYPSAEGKNVNSLSDIRGNSDRKKSTQDNNGHPLANRAMVLQFVKSPVSVNPCMSKQNDIYLQGEDRLFLNLGHRSMKNNKLGKQGEMKDESTVGSGATSRTLSESSRTSSQPTTSSINPTSNYPNDKNSSSNGMLLSSGNKQWTTVTIPHNYIGSSWPIRYTAIDDGCQNLAVAGRTGFAHYNIDTRRWRLFGNETQEKDFIVTGGLLWWNDRIIMGCYNLATPKDEIRIYPRGEKLDNSFAKILNTIDAQVLLINILYDQLIVFCADNVVSIYNLKCTGSSSNPSNLIVDKIRSYDMSSIPGLSFHPASVVLVGLSTLRLEERHRGVAGAGLGVSVATSRGDSYIRETSPIDTNKHPTLHHQISIMELPSIIINICGRVVMLQQYHGGETNIVPPATGRESPTRQLSLPTVLASGCETIWFPRATNDEKPHLTASLWLYCGAHGMRVWLPVFPRHGDHGHTFMSKRIMLHFPLEDFYPLAILFEDAIILGVENDTILYTSNNISTTCLPYSTLQRASALFLHPLLRQLIRRNLGYHAWEIARTCMTLPYFQHSLELLLHEVLEEEATSTEPIPDALLPSVIEFIQEFPVFLQTVGRCARKTEVALWHHLFSAVGSPRALFQECMNNNDLDTAASYLLILQNLEPPSVSQSHATLLLDAALDKSSWDLAKELTRFLRTIDPEDVEELPSRPFNLMTPQTPPILNTSEEEISLLLGTLQVPRGRTQSITHPSVIKVSPKNSTVAAGGGGSHDQKLNRSISESKQNQKERVRKSSSSSAKDQTFSSGDQSYENADDFYIDVILQRHARKLLSGCYLRDLGTFAAQLDFHMVSWLTRESNRAARVDNFVKALKRIHADFGWPYPSSPSQYNLLMTPDSPNSSQKVVSPNDNKDYSRTKGTSAIASGVSRNHPSVGVGAPISLNTSISATARTPRKSSNSSGISSSVAASTAVGGISAENSSYNTSSTAGIPHNEPLKVDIMTSNPPGGPLELTRSLSANGKNVSDGGSGGVYFSSKKGGISDSGYLSHHNAIDEPASSGHGGGLTNIYSRQHSLPPSLTCDNTTVGITGPAGHDMHSISAGVGSSLSEQTIQAMLKPHSFREDLSVLSEDAASNSLMSPSIDMEVTREGCQQPLGHFNIDSPTSDWSIANSSSHATTPTNDTGIPTGSANTMSVMGYSFVDASSTVVIKGPPKSEVQLRYLLQIMMEANCLEIASLISVVLKDALALIRIVNAARSPSSSQQTSSQVEAEQQKIAVSRIYQNLKVLEVWAQTECVGYVSFFQAIQPQLNSLRTFLLQQSMSYQQSFNPKKISATTAGGKHVSNFDSHQLTDKAVISSLYNSYTEATTNSRKNSPATTSLPPIYPGSGNRIKKSSADSKSSNVQPLSTGKPRVLMKKAMEDSRKGVSGGMPCEGRVVESTSSIDRENTGETKFFGTRSATLDQADFEKTRRNMLSNSIEKQRRGGCEVERNRNLRPIKNGSSSSSSTPNLNDSDNQNGSETFEDGGNCLVS